MTELFYKLPQDLTARKDLTRTAKVLYAVLVDKMGHKGMCWHGQRTLAKLIGSAREAVAEAIIALESAGLIVVERKTRGCTQHYRLPSKSGGETQPLSESKLGGEWQGKPTRGGRETQPQVAEKPNHNQKDQLNQTNKAVGGCMLSKRGAGQEHAASNQEVYRMLRDVGISENMCRTLSRDRRVTHAAVRDVISKSKGKNNPPGFVVSVLRSGLALPQGRQATTQRVCDMVNAGQVTRICGHDIPLGARAKYNGKMILIESDMKNPFSFTALQLQADGALE